ncbi:MAG TPA: isoleucine--tRNA ligase [Solirubrobacteraceae bacterium]|jgi:isoleucyl-tRNA synthetase|nr:isoleucine--tRNA ligase [Solirubrobacteraceae bacterium]
MASHRPVDPRPSFPALEEAVLERWREHDVFRQSVERRRGGPRWGFFEGPPTANGAPGSHHVLARVFKDIFTRYRTMCGYEVERKGGWDCHGLPVELAVERELGMKQKADIEEYGIDRFNARCREIVLSHIDDWTRLTERIGFWVDTEHAYKTLDTSYVESVWWALKTIYEKDLLFERLKVVPYCPRCGTALSSHELGQPGVYQDVEDLSAYVLLPSARGKLVVWTTTPWTLVSNAAVAVDPELIYVRTADDYIVAEALAAKLFGEGVEIAERFPGAELVGLSYEPPFDFIASAEYGELGHTVLAADFVTAEDGTGLVHTAIAFGEDDFRLGEANGLKPINPVLPDGSYDKRIAPYAGRRVKDCDADIVEDLRSRGRLLKAEPYEHSYPHCWRCNTALLYYAKPSWYIATSQIKDQLLAANETINWQPPHVKHGRFGNWLEGNVDWALSRERYWGTPLPVWRCPAGHLHVVGSLAELESVSGVALDDPHRPFVDDVTFACRESGCEEQMRRVPEVIDVWFDSGSMPFASYGSPHAGTAEFEAHFPADYICEALDQTRGWFYSMLAVSTLLFGESSYRNVVCLGLLLDENGRKMSKSEGNIVEPWDVLNSYGADAFRWYFFTSKYPWDGYRFSLESLGEAVRQFMLQLWNTYGFYVLYANANGVAAESLSVDSLALTDLDRWALSRLDATVETVGRGLDDFDATGSGRAIAEFVDDLSNWYVRRSRRRFWEGDTAAMATLHHALVTVAKLLAPFTPFVADEIYGNLDGTEPSVHLCDFPEVGSRDAALEQAMAVARETVRLGLAARSQAKIKLRQPLHAAVVVAAGAEREAIERLADIVREELNVRELRFVSEADELGEVEIKPNYRTLGPRFGAQMPIVAAAVAGLDAAHAAATLRDGGTVSMGVGGSEHALSAEDLLVSMKPLEGYQVEREGSHAVALELEIDESLRVEGWAREIVHAIQGVRRDSEFDISDRITLTLDGAEQLLAAAREHEQYIAGETLAVEVRYSALSVAPVLIDGLELRIGVRKA